MPPAGKPSTLEHIAALAGVSRSTVSRVINEDPRVRPEVRSRVLAVVEQTGYHPHAAARSLASRRSHIIGIIIPQAVNAIFVDPFFPLLLQGVSDAANVHGYHLMLSMLGQPSQERDFYRRALHSQMLDGLIISSALLDDPLIPRLLRDKIPFVCVGRYPDSSAISYVDVDNLGSAEKAVEHLIHTGRQRIATITGPIRTTVGLDRLEGYRRALTMLGLPTDERLIVEGDFTEASGYHGMQTLLPQRPDAVFVASDLMAVGAIRALGDADLKVPGDIAVVGFDDAQIASCTPAPLTTVRQPVYEMGQTAVDILLYLLAAESPEPQRRVLSTELIVRASSGAVT